MHNIFQPLIINHNMTNFILGTGLICLIVLFFAWLSGRGKSSDRRSALESIACSLISMSRHKAEETAEDIRTPGVVKTEALQEVDDAIRALKTSYKRGQVEMRTALQRLQEDVLPQLKDAPGKLEGKARKFKEMYLRSVESGHPLELHKANAVRALEHKAKALENIKRAEK